MSKSINQEVFFKASPKQVYEALLSGKFASPTDCNGVKAGDCASDKPSDKEGATFTLFGGKVEGRNVELVANKRIVQAWRPANWEAGQYSFVRFQLNEQDKGTKLVFDQSGFPEEAREHLATGWQQNYWEPLKKLLS